MKVLIVYAHPRQESFCHAILQAVTDELKQQGHLVTVRDLYALGFNPVLSAGETIHIVDGHFVRDHQDYPPDVQTEMDLIREHDLLLFIYPTWWNGYPAILKGYVDRVYQHGFAYSFSSDEPKAIFAGKKALFISTTGQPQDSEAARELSACIKRVTSGWLFNGNSVDVIDHLIYGRVPYLNGEQLSDILEEIRTRIAQL